MYKIKLISVVIFATLLSASLPAQTPAANKSLKIVADMLDSIHHIKTVRFHLSALERVSDGYLTANSEIKLHTAPRKLYFKNPQKKLEILYIDGQLGNKALVKPHIFPYVTMTLDPTGNLMRKNQHYTINELGFDFIGKTIALALSKEKENMIRSITYVGLVDHNGNKCHMVVYEARQFDFHEYTVQSKETVSSIALKFNVNDYMLRSKNDLFNDFGYLKKGSKLQIPNYYCKKAVFYIDPKTMLPVSVSVYDDKGLFESYDFTNIILNEAIPEVEFTRTYKDYKF